MKKDKVKKVDQLGRAILNFQISWMLIFFTLFGVTIIGKLLLHSWSMLISGLVLLYGYNIILIVVNTILVVKGKNFFYKPAIRILR
ncbi:MAG: DUF4870 domain-containing protein [Cyclobacteriaceae bacterium]